MNARHTIFNYVTKSLPLEEVWWGLGLGFLLLLVLSSCSDVSENERYTYVRPANVTRGVLIEDFTGQQCVNCPYANDIIHELQEQYGDSNVIAVGIHSGPLGFKGNATTKGLATDLGDTYYYHFNIEHQPQGMINRHGLAEYTAWSALVRNALEEQPSVSINLNSSYNSATRQATINADVLGMDNDVNGYLQVWLIEDSITALQRMPQDLGGGVDRNYVHNHVLRAAVNGDWGETIAIPATESRSFTYNYTLSDDYVARNCYFVVFVYNDSGVLQVVKTKVAKEK